MSTRSSILYDEDGQGIHLFEDVAMSYEHDGLHLDIPAAAMRTDSQYDGFSLRCGDSAIDLHLRLPTNVCEAIADYVLKRREYAHQAKEQS